MNWTKHDGGRAAAGYKGETGDCVVRAIAIATGLPYAKVYEDLHEATKAFGASRRCRVSKSIRAGYSSPRNGVFKDVYHPYLKSLGWRWTSCMGIGTGCQTHLAANELPNGNLIVQVSRHVVAVIDGTVYDTHDPTRGNKRCVYGYWSKETERKLPIWSHGHGH